MEETETISRLKKYSELWVSMDKYSYKFGGYIFTCSNFETMEDIKIISKYISRYSNRDHEDHEQAIFYAGKLLITEMFSLCGNHQLSKKLAVGAANLFIHCDEKYPPLPEKARSFWSSVRDEINYEM